MRLEKISCELLVAVLRVSVVCNILSILGLRAGPQNSNNEGLFKELFPVEVKRTDKTNF